MGLVIEISKDLQGHKFFEDIKKQKNDPTKFRLPDDVSSFRSLILFIVGKTDVNTDDSNVVEEGGDGELGIIGNTLISCEDAFVGDDSSTFSFCLCDSAERKILFIINLVNQ